MALAEITTYQDQLMGKCLKLSNDKVTMTIAIDFGPRIISLMLNGGDNIMYTDPLKRASPMVFDIYQGDQFIHYGGHRFQAFSEKPERLFSPDNQPVQVTQEADALYLNCDIEKVTNLQKSMKIQMDEEKAWIKITHTIKNCGIWEAEIAPCGASMLCPGGVSVIKVPKSQNPAMPAINLLAWGDSNLSDRRLSIDNEKIILDHGISTDKKLEFGLNSEDGTIAYFYHGQLFLRFFKIVPGGFYPYGNCTIKEYCDKEKVEIWAFGEADYLMPGDEVHFTEEWEIYEYVEKPLKFNDIDTILKRHLF